MVGVDLTAPLTQAEFGELVGVSQQAVSELVRSGHLPEGSSGGAWLLAYCGRLRAQAAGRGADGALVLAQERAHLAREQRIAQALKNAVSRKEYAPVGLLTEVLATASQAVATQLDALPGLIHKVAPEMSQDARDAVARTVAAARNGWAEGTAKLEALKIPGVDDDDDNGDELDDDADDEEGASA